MSKATTIEHNNRFYEQPNGEMLTENEQLKEWLKIANENNDYFREENVRLINREKELLGEIHNKINEIERLNNIINGMEKFFKYAYDNEVRPLNDRKVSVWTICLDKLQELKGSDK